VSDILNSAAICVIRPFPPPKHKVYNDAINAACDHPLSTFHLNKDINMNKHISSISLISITSLLLVTSASAFNNSNFKGGYAFRLVGPSSIVTANEPQTVATGVITANGKGSVTGHGKFRSAGITCVGTITGGYTINADGTGTFGSNLITTTPGCFSIVLDLSMALAQNGKIFEVANIENDYLSGSFTQQ
jgi:hypothetical protein